MGEILPESAGGHQWFWQMSLKFASGTYCEYPTVAELFGDTLNRVGRLWFTVIPRSGKAWPMRRLRKFVSYVSIAAMAVVPVLSVGCSDQAGSATPPAKTVSTTTSTTKTESTPDGGKKVKKEKKTKKTTTAESGSTTGAGVTPPVK
jgi:hypothetical protein